MKKNTVRVKFPLIFQISAVFSCLIFISLGLIGIISYRQIISKSIEPLIGKRLDFTARGVALRIPGETHQKLFALLQKDAQSFATNKEVEEVHHLLAIAQRQNELTNDIQTFVRDLNNPNQMILVMTSNEDLKTGQKLPLDPYVATVLKDGLPIFTPIFNRDGIFWISGLTTLETAKGDAVAVLRVDYPVTEEMQAAKADVIRTLVVAGSLAFVLASTIGFMLGRSLSRPVQVLAEAAKEVSGGNLEPKYEIQSQNEIGILASAFKNMLIEIRKSRLELESYSKGLEQKVKDRTADLREANSQISAMLNCLGQGFFMFNSDGICLATYSKACIPLLEGSPEGQNVTRYISGEGKGKSDWASMLFEEKLSFEDLIPICPSKFNHSKGRIIQLTYQPVRSESGKLTLVIGIATDRTAEVEAKKAAESEKAFSKLILSIADNREQFITFIRESIDITLGMKKSRLELGSGTISNLMRGLHTLKGGAAVFHLNEIRLLAHHHETLLSSLQSKEPLTQEDFTEFDKGVSEIEAAYAETIRRFKPLLGTEFESGEALLTVQDKTALNFYEHLKTNDPKSSELRKSFAEAFLYEPLDKSFKHYNEVVQQAADSLGKAVEPLLFTGSSIRINQRPLRKLFGTLIHAFRNAVDHGLETPEERVEAGKEETGKIKVEFQTSDRNGIQWLTIQIIDDGRGVNAQKVREKLAKSNPEHPLLNKNDDELIQVLFDSGFSTREQVTDWSGRGVGMDAILTEARKIGGSAKISSTLGKGSTLTVEAPV